MTDEYWVLDAYLMNLSERICYLEDLLEDSLFDKHRGFGGSETRSLELELRKLREKHDEVLEELQSCDFE